MRIALLTLLLFLCNDVFSFCITPKKSSIYTVFDYANTNGFVQIPKGGSLDSSSSDRPTLEELGINHFPANSAFFDIGLKFDWCQFGLYADYQHNHPNGTHTLTTDLLSHGSFFPAGTLINSKEIFDLYRFGFDKTICCTPKWALSTLAELTVFDFSYLISSADESTRRAFHQFTGRFGLGYNYDFNPYLTFAFSAATSIPVITNLQVQTIDFSVDINLLQLKRAKAAVVTGIGYQRIEFEDTQPLQNHILLEYAPITYIGIKFKY